jgi:hypothetical protein
VRQVEVCVAGDSQLLGKLAFRRTRFITRTLCLSPRRKCVKLVPWRIGRRLIYFVVIDTRPRFVVPLPA